MQHSFQFGASMMDVQHNQKMGLVSHETKELGLTLCAHALHTCAHVCVNMPCTRVHVRVNTLSILHTCLSPGYHSGDIKVTKEGTSRQWGADTLGTAMTGKRAEKWTRGSGDSKGWKHEQYRPSSLFTLRFLFLL
jgi:hypothetical protein